MASKISYYIDCDMTVNKESLRFLSEKATDQSILFHYLINGKEVCNYTVNKFGKRQIVSFSSKWKTLLTVNCTCKVSHAKKKRNLFKGKDILY